MIPQISIVIDTYNYSKYIEKAIDSVLNQTISKKMYEILVVDDGSVDDTPRRVMAYGNKVIYHRKRNGGQASAFNVGVSLARGEFISFLDADDYFYPTKLERVLKAFNDDMAVGVVFNKFDMVDEQGEIIYYNMPPKLYSGFLKDRVLLGYVSGSPASGISLRKKNVSSLHIPEKFFKISADYFYLNILPLVCKVAVIGTSEHAYRMHSSNLYMRKNKSEQSQIHALQNNSIYEVADKMGFRFFRAIHDLSYSPDAVFIRGRLRIFGSGIMWLALSTREMKLRIRTFVKLVAKFLLPESLYKKYQQNREVL